jgi:hypothetical protein
MPGMMITTLTIAGLAGGFSAMYVMCVAFSGRLR